MNNFKTKLPAIILAALLCLCASPALAGVTFKTAGQAKVGGLILNGVTLTGTGAELNTIHDEVASVSMTDVPATGADPVQFTFKNAAGSAVTSVRCLTMYEAAPDGSASTAVTSYATLTNGVVVTTKTGAVALATTTAAGLLGVTFTATAGSRRLAFQLPNGKVIVSPAIVTH